MKAKTFFQLKLYYTLIFNTVLVCNMLAQYGWPTGLHANQQQNITSTFMEYRPARYHVGIDIVPIDNHWNAYNVTDGYIDDIERFGFPNEHNERILVDGFSYIHVDVNDSLYENQFINIDTWLGGIYDPNPLGRHLHFEEGGQFVYGYAYNPFDCYWGIQPHTDDDDPGVYDFTFHRQGTGSSLSNYNLNEEVDIQVHCNDPVNSGHYGAIHQLAYQLRTPTGENVHITPNWNIIFDYWSTDNGFSNIWNSDDHIWVTNFIDPNSGQSANEFWDTRLVRNGDYRMYIIAQDLSCNPNQIEYDEDISINNTPTGHGLDIISPTEWFGEHVVEGVWDPTVGKYTMHVRSGNQLVFDSWSRVRIQSETWLIIDDGAELFIEPGAEVCLEGTGEIIGQPNGTINCNSNNLSFLGTGACFYVKGEFTFAENLTYNFNNGGIFVVDGGEVTIGDNAKLQFQSDSDGLVIKPGSTLKFGQNAKIEMYGIMLAQETAGNPITFQSSYANPTVGQYWDGIYMNDGNADDNSIIEHAVIEHGYYGILAYNASPEIRNSTIRDCILYALRLDYSTAEVVNNTFENSAAIAGVYMRYSDPVFSGNTIQSNNSKGLYLYQSNPDMTFNTLSQNDDYGIYCTYYSSPELGSSMEPVNPGNNTIEGHDVGIYASNYSQPFLGDYEAMPPYAGYNRVISNSSYAVKAYSNSHIAAHGNWWSSYPPPASLFYSDGTSSIDYAMALTADPNGSAPLLQTGSGEGYANSDGLMNGDSDPRQLMKLAKKLRRAKTPRKALKIYRKLLRQFPDHPLTRLGLRELIVTYREAQLDSAVAALLEATQNHANETVRQVAADLLTGEYLLKNEVTNAILHAQQTVARFPDSESEKQALFNLVHIFTFDTPDAAQAQQYLAQMQQKYPGDELTVMAATVVAGNGSAAPTAMLKSGDHQQSLAKQSTVPEKFVLHQNYPNPFNPTTTIALSLPTESAATLIIYDLSGRQVRTFHYGSLPAGEHRIVWDGRNHAGSPVSSGVYFYRAEAGQFTAVRKMLLSR